ncbi:MAG: FAD-dependent oxidoreductase [Saprospiraceae bacterium]|nr:FAD-dependent oxidoreductase [Saprospiraceae bacterium]
MNRNQNIRRLRDESFDLCIIGAGASGAGCALDAALRGLRVALIERDDFASSTSSKSTKLVHGGVRYLEQAIKNLDFAQLRQVRHGLQERHLVIQNAPHLAHPLGLLTPVFSWWESMYFSIGLHLYGLFASGKDRLPKSRRLSRKEALAFMPGLHPRIYGAVLYYDGQLDDARYALALAQSAMQAGAATANYLEVIDCQKDTSGKVQSVLVKDHLNGETFPIRAKHFLNCTGPGADTVRHLVNPQLPLRIRPSKGVHAVLPLEILGGNTALLIPKTKDGRVVFAVPFKDSLLLGTTDDPVTDTHTEPVLESKEIDFLLETLQPFVQKPVRRDMVRAGFGGLRPLLAAVDRVHKKVKTKSLLRDHEVEHDPVSGLFSLLGGKWTTYRLMARDAVDAICKALNVQEACTTASHLLAGAQGWSADLPQILQSEYGLDTDTCAHLSQTYGANARKVANLVKERSEWASRIVPGFPAICAEIVFATRFEMACTLRDFIARRIRLEIIDWRLARQAAPTVAQIMAEELVWTQQEKQAQTNAYKSLLDSFESHTDNAINP